MDTFGKVLAPVLLAVNIATLGAASEGTDAINAGSKAAIKTAQESTKLKAIFNEIAASIKLLKASAAESIGENALKWTADNQGVLRITEQGPRQVGELITIGTIGYTAQASIRQNVDLYQKEFGENFATMTSPEIEKAIDTRLGLGPKGREWVKREWGLQHLQNSITTDSTNWMITKNVLTVLSLEPVGIVSVVNAFAHPKCADDKPLPTVTPLFKY